MGRVHLEVWIRRLSAGAAFMVVVLVSAWPFAASADDEERGDGRTASPYFLVDGADPAIDRLPLKDTRVDVKVAGVIADVTVVQRYRNAGRRPIEARYVFPGGTRAAIHGMTVRIGDRVLEADVREKQAARVEYEAAKASGRTAALLEQHRANVFRMNVAHILPGDEVAVEIRYTELLVPVDGRYRFVFPTVVGPRYVGAGTTERWTAQPFLPPGEESPAGFALHARLASPIGIREVTSNTHVLDLKRDDDGAGLGVDVDLAKQGTLADRDVVIDYRLAGGTIASGALLDRGRDENFFLAMIEPPARVSAAAIVPREYVFVIDISGSMHGYPLETTKALMTRLIRSLRPTDTFNVMLFSGDNTMLAPRSLPATEANLAAALAAIRRQSGGGGTELVPALKRALAMKSDGDRARTFVVVTDGYVTVEREAFDLVRRNLGRANLFAFGIGSSVNRLLIEGLARAGQGEPFVVTQENEVSAEAERFRKMIESPVLTRVRMRFEDADGFQASDVEPAAIGDLFAAKPIVVFGKWTGTPRGRLVVEGMTANGPYRQDIDLATAAATGTDHPALARLWARHRIASLTDEEKLAGTSDQSAAITALGLKYHLMTAYTSFVAVDRVVRPAASPDAAVDQASPLPSGVSPLAVGAEVPATPEPPMVAMLAAMVLVIGASLAVRRRSRAPRGSILDVA